MKTITYVALYAVSFVYVRQDVVTGETFVFVKVIDFSSDSEDNVV